MIAFFCPFCMFPSTHVNAVEGHLENLGPQGVQELFFVNKKSLESVNRVTSVVRQSDCSV